MSLFPAYEAVNDHNETEEPAAATVIKDSVNIWLNNSSFQQPLETCEISDSPNVLTTLDNSNSEKSISPPHRKKKNKKHKKSKKSHDKSKTKDEIEIPASTFTGNELYYVDKKATKSYVNTNTLHTPICPRYYHHNKIIGRNKINFWPKKLSKIKRYFKKNYLKQLEDEGQILIVNKTDMRKVLVEEDFSKQSKSLNLKLRQNPKNVNDWIELIKLQEMAPIKCTSLQLAEKKIDILDKSLIHNLSNTLLYNLYIDILNITYPSFEVTKFLDKLLSKDPANYILWNAQILSVQGSMARCIVPDVLKLYEECMQKMYRKSQIDEVMLKLFTSCALFIRQSGLNEQFFALIKLALELNVSEDKFQKVQPSEQDQKALIEYEELILKSGLPMNEIWIRIEKLRQNFNFLPCPPNLKCSDPQRVIYNDEICYFIYPLQQKENCFQLILIILKLLKIPFISTASQIESNFLFQSQTSNEFDAIEDILTTFLYQTTDFSTVLEEFNEVFYELVKEIASSPSYLHSNIGYEIYLKNIIEIILICADCFKEDSRQRQIFVLIWLRFERIILILNKISKKITNEDRKQLKNKIKLLFKKDENRNVLNYYTEYSLIECEFGNFEIAEQILLKSIQDSFDDSQNSDYCYAYITYVELLIKKNDLEKALNVLTCYALSISINSSKDSISEPRKLLGLKKINERLEILISIEKNVEIMELEQYFLPDFLVNLIKAKTYLQILVKNERLEALSDLEKFIEQFPSNSNRNIFICEQIYEFYLKILRWPSNIFLNKSLLYDVCKKALKKFPYNLYILNVCATLNGLPWYKINDLLTESNTVESAIYKITSIQYRFLMSARSLQFSELYSSNIDSSEETSKIRIGNVLKKCISENSKLKKSCIIWRLYLRSLSDLKESFEKSKNALFSGLDECPWNKTLYLDGSIYVPQELSQLQDLIIEKQLRIYALPEELEILRNDNIS